MLPGQGQSESTGRQHIMAYDWNLNKLGSVDSDRAAHVPTVRLGAYYTNKDSDFTTDSHGITTRLVHDDAMDAWSIVGLDATVRTDLSRDEHELILAVREYNTAKDASDKANAALDEARDEADDASRLRDDAQNDFTTALSAVKHGGVWGF